METSATGSADLASDLSGSAQRILDVLEMLVALARNGARPHEARAALRPLEQKHEGKRIELIWQAELYDDSIHYDALLGIPGGTVAVSYCPDKALPWPLRGVQRWNDRDLLRVDNIVLEVSDAIRFIDFVSDGKRVTDSLLDSCVIWAELDRNPISVNGTELQVEMDAFRRSRGLYRAEETFRWLTERGLTEAKLNSIVTERVQIAKLRDRVTRGRIEERFHARRADFETVRLARTTVNAEADAIRLTEEIRAGASFLESAERCFLAGLATSRDLFLTLRRREAPAQYDAVFDAAAGDLVGPIRDGNGFAVVQVLSREEGSLNESTREAIARVLFEEWLSERRHAARVEWYWGTDGPSHGVSAGSPASVA